MAKHARVLTDEQRERRERNRDVMASVIRGASGSPESAGRQTGISLRLERIAMNRTTGVAVPYEGPLGIERVFAQLGETYREGRLMVDGHMAGVSGALMIDGRSQPVGLSATVGAGAQVQLTVGPSDSIVGLLDAIRVFDRQAHLAAVGIGLDMELLAQGYNPTALSPSDIVQVPLSRFVLMNAYLSRTGRYARDAMRCTAATRLMLPMSEDEAQSVEAYRVCAALAPVIAFLTDNTLCLRGSDPRTAPRMARSLVWDQLDATRCGFVPGTFGDGFGYEAYERWVEGIRPILFTSDEGVTFSTGTDTCARVMEERDLSEAESQRLLNMAFPDVRWNGSLEIRSADALPVRLACGYAALMKGLLSDGQACGEVGELLGVADLTEDDVERAWHDLRELGWKAQVYGRPMGQIADRLVTIATGGLTQTAERDLLGEIAQLWEVRYVPRDTLLRNWEQAHPQTTDEEAIELYGEGAVIPYDELGGDPPAGQTSELPIIRTEE